MAIDPKSLTIDFRKLLRMTVQDRVNMAKSQEGASWLGSLTPTQYAMLFPDYYRKALPDLGKSTSALIAGGGSYSGGGSEGSGGYSGGDSGDSGGDSAEPVRPGPRGGRSNVRGGRKNSRAEPYSGGDDTDDSGPKEPWQKRAEKRAETLEKQRETTTARPVTGKTSNPGLVKERARYEKELRDNPRLWRQIVALGKVEVGGMKATSKQQFLETLFNRAAVRGVSIENLISGRNIKYWGGGIGNPKKVSDKDLEEWGEYKNAVVAGANDTNYATDNASNDYRGRNALANKRHREGREGVWSEGTTGDFNKDKDKGEFFYTDTPYEARRKKLMARINEYNARHQAEVEAVKPFEGGVSPSATDVPQGDPSQTGSTNAEKSPAQVEPVKELPKGLDPGIVSHYDSLTPDEQTKFRKTATAVGADELNRMYKEDQESPPKAEKNIPGMMTKDEAHKVVAGMATGETRLNEKMLKNAMTVLGKNENRDTKTLMEYFKKGGVNWNPRGKSRAWCGVFVQTSLAQAGVKGTKGFAVASNWIKWGNKVEAKDVAAGDVLALTVRRDGSGRKIKVGQTGGHVGMATGKTKVKNGELYIQMYGGNQSDGAGGGATLAWYKASQLAVRRAPEFMKDAEEKRKATELENLGLNPLDAKKMGETEAIAEEAVQPFEGGVPPPATDVPKGDASQTGSTNAEPPVTAEPVKEKKVEQPIPDVNPFEGLDLGGAKIPNFTKEEMQVIAASGSAPKIAEGIRNNRLAAWASADRLASEVRKRSPELTKFGKMSKEEQQKTIRSMTEPKKEAPVESSTTVAPETPKNTQEGKPAEAVTPGIESIGPPVDLPYGPESFSLPEVEVEQQPKTNPADITPPAKTPGQQSSNTKAPSTVTAPQPKQNQTQGEHQESIKQQVSHKADTPSAQKAYLQTKFEKPSPSVKGDSYSYTKGTLV